MYRKTLQDSTANLDFEASPTSKSGRNIANLPGIYVKPPSVAERYRPRPAMAHRNPLTSSASVQQRFKKLHDLGPRAGLEFVDEVSRKGLQGADLIDALDRYCRIDLQSLQAVGGDRFPSQPLHSVSGGVSR